MENVKLSTNNLKKPDIKNKEIDIEVLWPLTQFNCSENNKVSLYFKKLLSFSSKNSKTYFIFLDDKIISEDYLKKQFFWYFTLFYLGCLW